MAFLAASSMPTAAWAQVTPQAVCPAYPFATAAPRVVSLDYLKGLLRDTVARYWPGELAGYRIELVTFNSQQDYLKSGVRPLSILRSARNRDYLVYVNENLLRDAPSDLALRAIFVHETKHVFDYTQMSSIHFIGWAAQYAIMPQAAYERRTDAAALEKGLGCGLMEYRVWLYRRVDAKTRAAKERDYFTPVQIAAWMAARAPRR